MSEQYAGPQIVGMDLHRRRSVLVRMTETGEHLETVRISNDAEYLREVMSRDVGMVPEDLPLEDVAVLVRETHQHGFPVGNAISTPQSLLFGFGLEGVSTEAERNAVIGRALDSLLA